MRKKLTIALLAVTVAAGAVVPRLRAQGEIKPYDCTGDYTGLCLPKYWIKNCYC